MISLLLLCLFFEKEQMILFLSCLPMKKMSLYCLNREIHPEGLPQAYTIILLFRLLPESPNEPFAIWQITDRDYKPQVGVVLDRKDDYTYCIENK